LAQKPPSLLGGSSLTSFKGDVSVNMPSVTRVVKEINSYGMGGLLKTQTQDLRVKWSILDGEAKNVISGSYT